MIHRSGPRASLIINVVVGAVALVGCAGDGSRSQTRKAPRRPGMGVLPAQTAWTWRDAKLPLPRFAPRVARRVVRPRGAMPAPVVRPAPVVDSARVSSTGAKPAGARVWGRSERALEEKVTRYYAKGREVRLLLETDKPLYRPGDTIWVRAIGVRIKGNTPLRKGGFISYAIIGPSGAVVTRKRGDVDAGHSAQQFELPASAVGGEYIVRAKSHPEGALGSHRIVVGSYQPPRIKKLLEFARQGYGGGETVTASLRVKRATGQPIAMSAIRLVARLGGKVVKRWSVKTDRRGVAVVAFPLPRGAEADEGTLTALVDAGGITESISRPIPLARHPLQVGFFPEGGKAVWGLPSRIYFAVRRKEGGKPVDVAGIVKDKNGREVARVRTFHDGMGRFLLTPTRGAAPYRLHLTRAGQSGQSFALPRPAPRGPVMQLVDDYSGAGQAVRVVVHSERARRIIAVALQHETLVGQRPFQLRKGRQLLHLPLSKRWRGILRLTLFDERLRPLAERLVFRHRGRGLRLSIAPDQKSYGPRDTVTVRVRVQSPGGKPLAGVRLGASVVDDSVLNHADDHEPDLLAQRYLTGQLTGRIHRPSFYFDPKQPKAGRALDLVMGTHGWRDFSWRAVLGGRPARAANGGTDAPKRSRPVQLDPRRRPRRRASPPAMRIAKDKQRQLIVVTKNRIMILRKVYFRPRSARIRPVSAPLLNEVANVLAQNPQITLLAVQGHTDRVERRSRLARSRLARQRARAVIRYLVAKGVARRRFVLEEYGAWRPVARNRTADGRARNRRIEFIIRRRTGGWGFGAVRQFPVRFYERGLKKSAIRDDFRETVYWNHKLVTDAAGTVAFRFGLGDSVSTFRIRVSGLGHGMLGRAERVISSRRPFFMVVKAPLEVSAGDAMALPLTLANDSKRSLSVRVRAEFSAELQPGPSPLPKRVRLAPGTARTWFVPVRVVGARGHARVVFRASGAGLTDAFEHGIRIRPRGFPRTKSWSGTLQPGKARKLVFDLPKDARTNGLRAQVELYPDPLRSLTLGMESMIREPAGCFEQASSSNYPNVMILRYLKARGLRKPSLERRVRGLLARGYRKLVGYETKTRGYEWFGRAPGHDALTGYGLAQFTDMRRIYRGVSAKMIRRTAKWLLAQRDGRGGFRHHARRLDSFGRASPEITDAYLTYSLVAAGRRDLARELDVVAKRARRSQDPYLLALAAGAWLGARGTRDRVATGLVKRLVTTQSGDGSFRGRTHSITRSTGRNLNIETTAFAVLALVRSGQPAAPAHRAIVWLRKQRNGNGGFGATQATVLALKAIIAYEQRFPSRSARGELQVSIGGAPVTTRAFGGAHGMGDVSIAGLARHLRPGKNTIRLALKATRAIPYSVAVRYTTHQPLSSPGAAVALQTSLAKPRLRLGETGRLTARVTNRRATGIPMTLVRLGLPGALRVQTWQLKALRRQKRIAFYETRDREVILYLGGMAPKAIQTFDLDLVARVTGNYVGPASSAYLYYTDDLKVWTPPLAVTVTP